MKDPHNNPDKVEGLTAHLFRHEYGKLVSSLTKLFGNDKIEIAEDLVQDTIVTALTQWRFQLPENPKAWLYKVAKNKAIDYLRKAKFETRFPEDYEPLLKSAWSISRTIDQFFLDKEVEDNLLQMIFAACHPQISWEAQVTLILKTLCGFSIKEIARAFLTSEDTVTKRLYRAKIKLRKSNFSLRNLSPHEITSRLTAVLKSIYLLFNEGYNSISGEKLIRKDLCLEAMRLCLLLTEHPQIKDDRIFSLMALMCYHSSRFEARISQDGNIVTMANQNRALWNGELIEKGDYYMHLINTESLISRYHLEAAISGFYCHSKNYESINWKKILFLYNELQALEPSPIILLNRSVVLSKVHGPSMAIKELLTLNDLNQHHHYHCILGSLYAQITHQEKSLHHYNIALDLAPTSKERNHIRQRIDELL